MVSLPEIKRDRSHSVSDSLRNTAEGEDSFSEYSVDRLDSPLRIDYKKLQEQNKDLIRRNQKLSNTLDALRKERELITSERDRLKQEKREEYVQFTKKLSAHTFADQENQALLKDNKGPSSTSTPPPPRLIVSVEQEGVEEKSKLTKEENSDVPEDVIGSPQHKSTLNKLIEEQKVTASLRSSNTELTLRVATLESEIEKLHFQNSHNLLLVEQANAAAQAATSLISTNTKQKKKTSIFSIRRSGRKKSSIMDSPSKSATNSGSNILSNSQPSLDGSLSEHDLHCLSVTKKPQEQQTAVYNPFNKPPDAQLLQTSVKLAMEEKVEVERQLACLRGELNSQQQRIEELFQDITNKERIYIDAVEDLERTKQALQLATRERDLQISENESLSFEIESLRAKKETTKGREVKAVLKEKQEMEFLRSENKALMSEIRTLIVNSDGLETSLSQLKREKVARDVREHETKLKLKKSDQENQRLKRELAEAKGLIEEKIKKIESMKAIAAATANISAAKPPHGGPKITISRNSESPPRDKTVGSLTTEQELQSPEFKQIGSPVYIDANRKTSSKARTNLHERAQSEDLTSHPPNIKSGGVPMQRTSSGGTKVIAVQATLPIKETPLLSTSLPIETKLGAFQPSSPKVSDVNSLVKMFETGKPKDTETPPPGKKTSVSEIEVDIVPTTTTTHGEAAGSVTTDKTTESSSNVSSSNEKNPSRLSSPNAKGTSPVQGVTALESKNNEGSSSMKTEQEVKKSQNWKKSNSNSKLVTPSSRKSSNSSPPSGKGNDTHTVTKETTSQSTKTDKQPERKNSSSSIRKLSHGSSESKYLPKKEDLKTKEQSHRRTTSLVIAKDQSPSTSQQQKKQKDGNDKVEATSIQQKRDSMDHTCSKEKLNTISELRPNSPGTENALKQNVSKHMSRFSVTVEKNNNNNVKEVVGTTKNIQSTAEKSQTWPIKSTVGPKSSEPSTNTLPSTNKGGTSTSPTQSITSLGIAKPKPPPTVKTTCPSSISPTINVVSQSESTQSPVGGIVRNLKSSFEKKSLSITKTASTPSYAHEQSNSSYTSPFSPNKPIVKYDSGPAGVIISSPGIKKPSPPPSSSSHSTSTSSSTPLSPTSKFNRTYHTQPTKSSGPPATVTTPTSTENIPCHNRTSPTALAVQQNGIPPTTGSGSNYLKSGISKRISSFESSTILDFDNTDVKKRAQTTNGTSSPRFIRRPASLYVPSTQSPDNKQLRSLISILQEKSTSSSSSSPPPPVTENKQTVQQQQPARNVP